MPNHELIISYGVSRGAETYGYAVVTLRERGEKKARCTGGGYDMRGTVFADWLQAEYQTRLLELAKAGKFPQYNWNGVQGDESRYVGVEGKKDSFYGGFYYANGAAPKKGKTPSAPFVSLDGGCGFSSIIRIAEAIGLEVRGVFTGLKTTDVIIVTDARK